MIEGKAIEAYEACLDTALQQSWFNEFSTKAEVALADLLPRKYRKPSELRARPTYSPRGFAASEIIADALAGEEDATMQMEREE